MSELIRKRVTSISNYSGFVNVSPSDSERLPETVKLKPAKTARENFFKLLLIIPVLLFLSYNTLPESLKEASEASAPSVTAASNTIKTENDPHALDASTSSPAPPISVRKRKGDTITVEKQNEGHEFSIEVYKRNDIVSDMIRSPQSWEQDTVLKLNSYFREYSSKHSIPLSNLTFIDIGAHVGWFALNMAALGVQVIAFEPMQQNIELINKSLRKADNIGRGVSGRIKLFPHGLGTKDQICIVYSHNINVGDGHVQCVEKEENLRKPDDYSIRGRIPVRRLDDVLDVEGLNIVAIKMDTEGYEGNVLEGGRKVILEGGAQSIVTEFEATWMKEKGGEPIAFMTKLAAAGYRLQRSRPDTRRPLSDSQRDFMSGIEMIAAAKSGPLSKGIHELTLRHESYISEHYNISVSHS